VDEQLRPPPEEVGQRCVAVLGLEDVVLLNRHPRQLPPALRQLVAAAGVLLLRVEQVEPGGQPLLAGAPRMRCHHRAPSVAFLDLGGRSFWTSTRAVTTHIQSTLMA